MTPPNPTLECSVDFPLVLVESPFAGDIPANEEYARACLRDCLKRGEAPFASHLLYTQPGVLDDSVQEERSLGIRAGMAWGSKASKTVVYVDRGISGGMRYGIQKAKDCGREVEFRTLTGARVLVFEKRFREGKGGPLRVDFDIVLNPDPT